MGERVSGEAQFRAPVADLWAVLLAIENYPTWNPGILSVSVDDYDADGRVTTASFVIDIKLAQLRYTLDYTYGVDHVSWQLTDGDLLSQFDGTYRLTHAAGITTVAYTIDVDVTVALPRAMKRRAAESLIAQTLSGLATVCEPA